MEDATVSHGPRHGYFHNYLARMAPTPLPPPPLSLPKSSSKPKFLVSRGISDRKQANASNNKVKSKTTAIPRKSLVDAFKQHGMKLCDGSKLNAVSKGVTSIGVIPPTLGVHIAALYLSQNDLRGLDGIEQFTSVRLLSVASNLLIRFADIERLHQLPQLRHLNVMGNPICEHPNYRFRVVDALRQLHVLDTIEISKEEREVAPRIASQDRALREMVMKNHFEIQKLQRLAVWILVLSELRSVVMRDAVTGRFDQLPSLQSDGMLNVDRFLHLWRYEDVLSVRDRDVVEVQVMAIVARTKSTLAMETPHVKAKQMLLKLTNSSSTPARRGPNVNGLPAEMCREFALWEEAFAHVLQLQQQTMANQRSECDRRLQEMMQSLRQLVVVNPYQRRGQVHQRHSMNARVVASPSSPRRHELAREENGSHRGDDQSRNKRNKTEDGSDEVAIIEQPRHRQEAVAARPANTNQGRPTLRRVLRSGEFGNKTLHEAVERFKLRDQPISTKQPQPHSVAHSRTIVANHAAQQARDAEETVELPQKPQFALMASSMMRVKPRRGFRPNHDDISDVGSSELCGSETVYSSDSLYAPSVSGFSSVFDAPQRNTIVAASSAQHTRLRDEVGQHRIARPHELTTVYENERSSNTQQPQEHYDGDQDGDEAEHRKYGRSQINETATTTSRPSQASVHQRERWQELEDREAKYLHVLMESEQRELDLRQQIGMMAKQITKFQQSQAQNDHERQKIKLEIQERVVVVARPSILRRFFIKWIQFHSWAWRVDQFRRKRQFIVQHDTFWCWRRQVWTQQQLRRQRTRHRLRLLRAHVTEWANLTRIAVIAVHTQALRQSHLLKRVLQEWRQQAHVQKLTRKMQVAKTHHGQADMVSTIFQKWKQLARRTTQLQHLHQFYLRSGNANNKRTAFNNWKIYVLSVARPQRERANALVMKQRSHHKQRHLAAWKMVAQSEQFHRRQLRLHMWQAWKGNIEHKRLSRQSLAAACHGILERHFTEWRRVASQRITRRRALILATRQRHHRRLRKLWMHWKIFSIAHRRYRQGQSKAYKHYFMKLVRRVWATWKRETREHVVSIKQKKCSELRLYFHAFRNGVGQVVAAKKRVVFVRHAMRRRLLALRRKVFAAWAARRSQRQRCSVIHRLLQEQRSRALRTFVWSRWKHQRLLKLQSTLIHTHHHVQSVGEEKQGMEDELVSLRDRTISLSETIDQLNKQIEIQAVDLQANQKELEHRENVMIALENEIVALKTTATQVEVEQETSRRRRDSIMKSQEGTIAELIIEKTECKATIKELERALEASNILLATSNEQRLSMEVRLKELTAAADGSASEWEDRERSLQATMHDLSQRLEAEQREREETVRRLQEYEARIASTCAEISDHEAAHEQESVRLRVENTRVESLWKAEAVRNAELQRLVSEKNDQIIALSARRAKDTYVDNQSLAPPETSPAKNRCDLSDHDINEKDQEERDNGDEYSHQSRTATVATQVPTNPPTPVLSERIARFTSHTAVQPEGQLVKLVHVGCDGGDAAAAEDIVMSASDVDGAVTTPELGEEERQIDAQTSRIHADLQLLQERITKRLQQTPCVPTVDEVASYNPKKRDGPVAVDLWDGSVSSLSESEEDGVYRRDHVHQLNSGHDRRKPSTAAAVATSQVPRPVRSPGASASAPLMKKIGRRVVERNKYDDGENVARIANRRPTSTSISRPPPPSALAASYSAVKPTRPLRTQPYPYSRDHPRVHRPSVMEAAPSSIKKRSSVRSSIVAKTTV